ncbi:N-acetylmuramoyl-L-alanine amidase family protein [Penaeicola halotolerans]|uniref:N-acetylmuramoyl-L-alanine amidase family protein n=1 Tax=Penaeicola halotolerans TaxID=2793196 RepID=UPI001CF84075|nr:N-acetylmuramoyl-L-alanine amidase [Penaeicola halotolerans]
MKNILAFSLVTISILLCSFIPAGETKYRVKKVVIDAGHGGKDPGTLGSFSKEKDVALAIALKLGETIKENLPDVEVIYTRSTDKFVELYERPKIANKESADFFISIHCNASSVKTVKGTETYVMGVSKAKSNLEVAKRENSVILLEDDYKENYEGFEPDSPETHIMFSLYQGAFRGNSLRLAESLEDQFKNRVGRNSRGVKQEAFWVLWATSMPSVLIEAGFLSNPEEEKYLNDKLGQTYIASAIFRAFRDYKVEVESMN